MTAGPAEVGGTTSQSGLPRQPPLAGRREELGRLRTLLGRAEAGHGGVVVLRGEVGMGKTRLLQELSALAAARGVPVHTGQATQPDQTRPFGPVAEAFGISLNAPRGSEQAELANEIYVRPPNSGWLQDVPVEEHYLLERLMAFVEDMFNRSALVVALDDLHWADVASLRALAKLARLCAQYPALLVLTMRPSDRPEVEVTTRSALSAGGELITLSPLNQSAVEALAANVLGARSGPKLRSALDKAAGNPLFVLELASALAKQGLVKLDASGEAELVREPAPVALEAEVLYDLGVLTKTSLELLRVAAFLGPEIDLAELALLTGRNAAEVATILRSAASSGLISASEERASFRHELVREALYQDWPLALRGQMHRQIARLLAGAGAPAYRVAYHFSAATTRPDAEAMAWLHKAGLQVAPTAPATGVQLLQRALELAPSDDPNLDKLRTDLAVALVWVGRDDEGELLARAVVEEARDPKVRGLAAWWAAFSLLNRYKAKEACEISSLALTAGVEPAGTRMLIELTKLMAEVLLGASPKAEVTGRLRELLAEAEHLGDRRVRSNCLTAVAMVEAYSGHLTEAERYAKEAVNETISLPRAELAMSPTYIAYAWALEEEDRPDEALATLESRERSVGPLPLSTGQALTSILKARILFAAGRWDDALSELASVFEWGSGQEWPDALVLRASICLHRDELAQARGDLSAIDTALANGQVMTAIDYLALTRVFLEGTKAHRGPALEGLRFAWRLSEEVPLAMLKPKIGPVLVRLLMAEGDRERAWGISAALGALSATNPAVARLAAAAAWARGLAEDSTGELLVAVAHARKSHRPLERGLICEDAAAALALEGDVGRARELLKEALENYDGLLASRRSASAQARLRTLGVRAGSRKPRRRPLVGWASLTETEARVAALVAEHLSNPQIAERLFVSRRTVETHVSNALSKLGLASRGELAEVASARNPSTPFGSSGLHEKIRNPY